jgi:hypothetical protein
VSPEILARAVRDGIARTIAVIGPGKFGETPYLAWMYIALIAGCLAAAVALVRSGDRRAWKAAALLPLGALVGYTLTRTVGLPHATNDIGNWTEPLGLASLFVEGSLVALACAMLSNLSGVRRFTLVEAVRT